MQKLIVQIVTGGMGMSRGGLICQDNGSGPKNSVPARNKQDQAFNGNGQGKMYFSKIQNIFVQITKYFYQVTNINILNFKNSVQARKKEDHASRAF